MLRVCDLGSAAGRVCRSCGDAPDQRSLAFARTRLMDGLSGRFELTYFELEFLVLDSVLCTCGFRSDVGVHSGQA